MTPAEIDQKIAELKQAIEKLEKKRDTACPFRFPVTKKFTGRWIIVEEESLTEICRMVRPDAQQDVHYIARAINAYPAYLALRAFWGCFRETNVHLAFPNEPDGKALNCWLTANDAIKVVEKDQ